MHVFFVDDSAQGTADQSDNGPLGRSLGGSMSQASFVKGLSLQQLPNTDEPVCIVKSTLAPVALASRRLAIVGGLSLPSLGPKGC
jgi:hypothetical protein